VYRRAREIKMGGTRHGRVRARTVQYGYAQADGPTQAEEAQGVQRERERGRDRKIYADEKSRDKEVRRER
jgi:hypothetical protein